MSDVPTSDQSFWSRGFAVLSLCAAGALAILVMLGNWQIDRLHWKEGLLDEIETKIAAPPVALTETNPDDTPWDSLAEALEYRPITVTGTFVTETKGKSELYYYATKDGTVGWHVYAPLALADKDQIIFVNRGFVPQDRRDPSTRLPTPTGIQTISGLFRWPDDEKPNSFIPENNIAANQFFWRELDLMVEASGLQGNDVLPFFIYAERKDDDRLPIGGVTLIDFPNNHLSYALTWYGLGVTLVGVYIALAISRFRRRGSRVT